MAYNLLIVDDSTSMRAVVRKVLDMAGVEANVFHQAANGLEALEIMAQNKIDLVLTDINMPEMDGLELIAAMNESESWRDIPVIIITTEGSRQRQEEALAMGAIGYLQKPFQPEEVRALLDRCFGSDNES